MSIGQAAYFARIFDVAEAAYRTAIMNGESNPWAWKSLGLTLLATGRAQEADRILRFCVRKILLSACRIKILRRVTILRVTCRNLWIFQVVLARYYTMDTN